MKNQLRNPQIDGTVYALFREKKKKKKKKKKKNMTVKKPAMRSFSQTIYRSESTLNPPLTYKINARSMSVVMAKYV